MVLLPRRKMGHERTSGETNRREFLAGSVGALAATKLGSKFMLGAGRDGALSSAARSAALSASRGLAPTAAAPHRIIIDTDPGVDDALAILLALRSPELQVE